MYADVLEHMNKRAAQTDVDQMIQEWYEPNNPAALKTLELLSKKETPVTSNPPVTPKLPNLSLLHAWHTWHHTTHDIRKNNTNIPVKTIPIEVVKQPSHKVTDVNYPLLDEETVNLINKAATMNSEPKEKIHYYSISNYGQYVRFHIYYK